MILAVSLELERALNAGAFALRLAMGIAVFLMFWPVASGKAASAPGRVAVTYRIFRIFFDNGVLLACPEALGAEKVAAVIAELRHIAGAQYTKMTPLLADQTQGAVAP